MTYQPTLFDWFESFRVIAMLTLQGLWHKIFGNPSIPVENEISVTGDVVVITGASRGMGKAMALQMAKRNATVILGCVDMHEGNETVEEIRRKTGNLEVVLMHLDLADMDSVQRFAVQIKTRYPKVKILLNNAGIGGSPDENMKTKDGFNIHVAVNHMGHFLLTNLLENNLRSATPSRVVSMSSTMQLLQHLDLDDINMDKSGLGIMNGFPYCNTKYMNALFIKELAKRWGNSGITTYALCPGGVRTQIYESTPWYSQLLTQVLLSFGGFSPEQACETILHCCLSKSVSHETGRMYRFKKQFLECNAKMSDDLAQNLWDLSAKLVKLDYRKNNLYAL